MAANKIHQLARLIFSVMQFLHRYFYAYKSKHLNHVIYGLGKFSFKTGLGM